MIKVKMSASIWDIKEWEKIDGKPSAVGTEICITHEKSKEDLLEYILFDKNTSLHGKIYRDNKLVGWCTVTKDMLMPTRCVCVSTYIVLE